MATVRMRRERTPRPPRRVTFGVRRIATVALGLSVAAAGTTAFAADLPLNGVRFSSAWDSHACTSASVTATTTVPVVIRFVWLNASLTEIAATEATLTPAATGPGVATSTAPSGARAFVFDVLDTSRQKIPMGQPRPATCQRVGEAPIVGSVPSTQARPDATAAPTMHVPGLPGFPLPNLPAIPGLPGAGGPLGNDGADIIQGVPLPSPTVTVTTTPTPTATSVGTSTVATGTMAYDGSGARLELTPIDATTVRIDATSENAPRGSVLVITRASDRSVVSRLPMNGTKSVSLVAQPGEKYVATVVQRAAHRAAVSSGAFSVEGQGATGAVRYTGVQPRSATDPVPTPTTTVAPAPTTTALPVPTVTTTPATTTSVRTSTSNRSSTSTSRTTTKATKSSTTAAVKGVPTTSAEPTSVPSSVAPPLDIPAILQDNPVSPNASNLAQTGRNSGAGALLGGGLLLLGGAIVMMARRMKSHA